MIRYGRVPVSFWIISDFVTPFSLPVERKASFAQACNHFAVTET